jgi:hypothetical protein
VAISIRSADKKSSGLIATRARARKGRPRQGKRDAAADSTRRLASFAGAKIAVDRRLQENATSCRAAAGGVRGVSNSGNPHDRAPGRRNGLPGRGRLWVGARALDRFGDSPRLPIERQFAVILALIAAGFLIAKRVFRCLFLRRLFPDGRPTTR